MVQIKATDIMINDWVYLSKATKYAMRVTSIDEDHCYLDFEGNEGEPFDGIYGKDGIAPIPLTDDILLLNEWQYDLINRDWTTHRSDEMVIEVLPDGNGEPFLRVFDDEITLTYVHELQHIMRLYGLNDMADNFKIK